LDAGAASSGYCATTVASRLDVDDLLQPPAARSLC